MRHHNCAAFFAALALGLCFSTTFAAEPEAKSPSDKPAAKATAKPAASVDELAAIRAESQAFTTAFNKGDAAALAALWTENGDYQDEAGRTFKGREAIQQEYAKFFKAHRGTKLRVFVDSLRLLSDSAAIEDGRAILDPTPAGVPAMSKYTVVHVKVDGKWKMSTVRDVSIETPSAYRKVADLEWLIGTWTAEEHGAKTESVCRWIANKSFVERTHKVTHPDGTTATGLQIIGFNPSNGRVQSWDFSSDGGHAFGVWTPRADGWQAEVRGVMSDGTPTSAVNLLIRLDDDAYAWQSVRRVAGNTALRDTDEVIVRRIPSK